VAPWLLELLELLLLLLLLLLVATPLPLRRCGWSACCCGCHACRCSTDALKPLLRHTDACC
jgi:hypothetical protein